MNVHECFACILTNDKVCNMHAVVRTLTCCLFISLCEVESSSSSTIKHKCGVPRIQPRPYALRIVGGDEATPHSWPWMVTFMLNKKNGPEFLGGGGTIIAPHLIVTCAHGIGNPLLQKYLILLIGAHNATNSKEKSQVMIMPGEFNVTVHERYKEGNVSFRNDIALIHLKNRLKFNRYIQPICLPSHDVEVGTDMYATGWGRLGMRPDGTEITTDVLRQVSILLISNEQCRQAADKAYSKVNYLELCAGVGDPPQGGCTGDSGSPLVAKKGNGRWTMYGVTSYAPDNIDPETGKKLPVDCVSKNGPMIYTRVAKYVKWIRRHWNLRKIHAHNHFMKRSRRNVMFEA